MIDYPHLNNNNNNNIMCSISTNYNTVIIIIIIIEMPLLKHLLTNIHCNICII